MSIARAHATLASADLRHNVAALGADYALFLVVRYRAARQQRSARDAIAETMDTAGKAVLLSGVTMLISLSAVLLVPSPSFRSAAGGIMLSVGFVLAAGCYLVLCRSKIEAEKVPA